MFASANRWRISSPPVKGGATMTCERCNSMSGEEAAFRVRSDIIDLKVCRRCASEAGDLALQVEPLSKNVASAAKAAWAAASGF